MTDTAMAARKTNRATERDFVWNFCRAEIESRNPEFQAGYVDRMSFDLEMKVRQGQRTTLTDDDWTGLERALDGFRGRYATPFLGFGMEWWSASLPVAALPALQIANHPPLVSVARSRRLEDYVKRLDAGEGTPGDTAGERYRSVRPIFDLKRVRGLPILVAETSEGPYTIVEGLTRLSCQTSLFLKGTPAQEVVPILLGISPRVKNWKWY